MEVDYADKINKLLRKAESTTFAEERDAYLEKAQKLMTLWGIDEAMLADRADKPREEIIKDTVEFGGIYKSALFKLATYPAGLHNVRTLYHNRTWGENKAVVITLIGFESDVRRVKMLATSLQLQALQALKTDSKQFIQDWMSGMEKFKARRSFVDGFCQGVYARLQNAVRAAEQEDAINRAAAANTTVEEASSEVAIVMRSRRDQVNDWMDREYGQLRTVRTGGYQSGGMGARAAGEAAGRRANTGDTGLGGGGGRLRG